MMLSWISQHVLVDHRLVAERPQVVRDVVDRGQRKAIRERRHAGIDDADAELDGFERDERA